MLFCRSGPWQDEVAEASMSCRYRWAAELSNAVDHFSVPETPKCLASSNPEGVDVVNVENSYHHLRASRFELLVLMSRYKAFTTRTGSVESSESRWRWSTLVSLYEKYGLTLPTELKLFVLGVALTWVIYLMMVRKIKLEKDIVLIQKVWI